MKATWTAPLARGFLLYALLSWMRVARCQVYTVLTDDYGFLQLSEIPQKTQDDVSQLRESLSATTFSANIRKHKNDRAATTRLSSSDSPLNLGANGALNAIADDVRSDTSTVTTTATPIDDDNLQFNNTLGAGASTSAQRQQAVPTYATISNDEFYFKDVKHLLTAGIAALSDNNLPQIDAVIVPSGGIDASGAPHVPVKARLDGAAALNTVVRYFLHSGAYTPLKPVVLSASGHPVTEARSDANYMADQYNIPKHKFILEEMSRDTLGNAFFSRIICELMHFHTLVVTTNKFHMPRTRAIFDWVFDLADAPDVILLYLEAPNAGMSLEETQERDKKERDSLEFFWLSTRPGIATMEDLSKFIYMGHRAYAYDTTVGSYNVVASPEALKLY